MARRLPHLPLELILAIAEQSDAGVLRSFILSSRSIAFLTSSLLAREHIFNSIKRHPDLQDSSYWEEQLRAWGGEHLLSPFSRLSAKQVNRCDNDGKTLLHFVVAAGNVELTKILLERGASVNILSSMNRTLLMSATENGYEEVSRLLLAAGVDPCRFDCRRDSALYLSILNGTGDLVRLIFEEVKAAIARATPTWRPYTTKEYLGMAKYRVNSYGVTPPVLAAERGNLSVLEFVVSSELADCETGLGELLDTVSAKGHIACCEFLIGVIRNSRPDDDPADWCTTAAAGAIRFGQIEVFKLFVDQGLVSFVAPVDGAGSYSGDLLRTALECEQREIAEVILEACPEIDLQSYLWPDMSRYKDALQNNDPDLLKPALGPNPFAEARRTSTILSLLKHPQTNLNTPSPFQNYTTLHFSSQNLIMSPSELRTLLRSGADPRRQTAQGNLPLHLSARSGDSLLSTSKTLLHAAPDTISAKNNTGKTPLHSALTPENQPVTETVSLLLSSGADVHSRDNSGRTPLHTAVLHNRGREAKKKWEAIKLLVQAGASLEAVDNEGATPVHLAVVGRQSLRLWGEVGGDMGVLRGHCDVCKGAFEVVKGSGRKGK